MVDFTGGTWRSLIDGEEVSVAFPESDAYRYLLDEGSGDASDSSTGSNSDAELLDGASWKSRDDAIGGYAVDMSESNGVLRSVSSDMSLGFSSNELTAISWVMWDSTTDETTAWISHGELAPFDNTSLTSDFAPGRGSPDRLRWRGNDDGDSMSDDIRFEDFELNQNEWYLIALTRDGTDGNIHIWDTSEFIGTESGNISVPSPSDEYLQYGRGNSSRDEDIILSYAQGWTEEKSQNFIHNNVWEVMKDEHN